MEHTKFAIERDTLVKALTAVMTSASKDETRPHLAAVLVETRPDDGLIRFVSTDGHRLTRLDVPAFPEWNVDAAELVLPAKKVEALIKALRGARQSYPEPITVSADGRSVTFRNEVTADVTGFSASDETFPPYEKVIPDYTNKPVRSSGRAKAVGGGVPIGFNPAYMADVAKVAKFAAGTSGGVKASFGTSVDPIRIDLDNGEVSAVVVIMPMRM